MLVMYCEAGELTVSHSEILLLFVGVSLDSSVSFTHLQVTGPQFPDQFCEI
jgi:hypothetical protein